MQQVHGHGFITEHRPDQAGKPLRQVSRQSPPQSLAQSLAKSPLRKRPPGDNFPAFRIGPHGHVLRRRGRRIGYSALMAVFSSLLGAGVFLTLTAQGRETRAPGPISEQAQTLMAAAGLAIDQVSISGYRLTSEDDVFAALDPALLRNLLEFDSNALRKRIEALPWVYRADVRRVYPSRVDVQIRERRPFAVWEDNGQRFLVDYTGRARSPLGGNETVNLPRIAGAGAGDYAARLMAVLSHYPNIQSRVRVAERHGGRRWTLHLSNGSEILLPADEEARALRTFAEILDGDRYLNSAGLVIDLRAHHRVSIGPTRRSGLAAPRSIGSEKGA